MKTLSSLQTKILEFMYSSEDLERFYFQYQTEALPHGESVVNYSTGMAEDQKDRYIQYLAEQNQDLRLTGDAMKLVLEDFMAQMNRLRK